jgi:hypothetical protein
MVESHIVRSGFVAQRSMLPMHNPKRTNGLRLRATVWRANVQAEAAWLLHGQWHRSIGIGTKLTVHDVQPSSLNIHNGREKSSVQSRQCDARVNPCSEGPNAPICIQEGVVVEKERLDMEAGRVKNQSQTPATLSGQVHGASNT